MAGSMEGRWGRRIFGSIAEGPEVTTFTFTFDTSEGKHLVSRFRAANSDLQKYPRFYHEILDTLTAEIQKALDNINRRSP